MSSQLELEFRAAGGGKTQNDRLRAILVARPGEWIPMVELGRLIGAWAVHSRIADLRRVHGMRIECRASVDPVTGQRLSSYRYDPASSVQGA